MAEAYGKKDLALCESYWLTVMKWFTLFGGLGLFFYFGWSKLYITALSGDEWATAGDMLLFATPALFIRKANDTFSNILQGINAPHDILIGTALRIPILVLGGFIFFKYWGIYGMAMTLNLMEIVYFLYMYWKIKRALKVKTPLWMVLIPFIVGFVDLLIVKSIMFFIPLTSEILQLFISMGLYFLLYFVIYPLSGAMELNDIPLLEQSMGMLIKNKEKLGKLLGFIQKYASLSPLFARYKSETLLEIRQRLNTSTESLQSEEKQSDSSE
jgi:O-antigen/teichoic acid export membrane protein